MKKLSFSELAEKETLSASQMKQIKAGATFRCGCSAGGANPPYNSSWTTRYTEIDSIENDIKTRCRNGGNCNAI